jgi:hypothetical protein
MTRTATRALPSALPATEDERAAWQTLPREEQLARFREVLLGADAQLVSTAGVGDVVAAARARAAARGG